MSTFAITEWQSLCLKFGLCVNCISSYITSISNKTYLVSLLSEEVNSPIIFQLPFISLTWTGWKHSPFVLVIAQSLSSCATEHICSLHFLFLQPFHFWFGVRSSSASASYFQDDKTELRSVKIKFTANTHHSMSYENTNSDACNMEN